MRVNRTGASAPAKSARKAAASSGGFRVDGAPRSAPGAAGAAASAEALSALIALQGEAGLGERTRARRIAAAQRMLDVLEQIRLGLLETSGDSNALDALELAAALGDVSAGGDEAGDDLAQVLSEISLRAKVELAKRGR